MKATILLAGRREPEWTESLDEALRAAEAAQLDRFVVLERSGQHYMQCLCKAGGWQLEKREGDENSHFRAGSRSMTLAKDSTQRKLFEQILGSQMNSLMLLDFDEVSQAMNAYYTNGDEPDWLEWERVTV